MPQRPDPSHNLRKPARQRRISPLMLRIMAVNFIALAMLFAGILYLDEFQARWVERRVENLKIQSEIIAGAIGEAASEGPESIDISVEPARQIIGRLIGPTNTRARLFSVDGHLLADSRFMALGRSVYVVPLPPPGAGSGMGDQLMSALNKALDWFAANPVYPPYAEHPDQTAEDYEEVMAALAGETATIIRSAEDGAIISAAVPVQRFRRVLGVLLLSADTVDIQETVESERLRILKVFGVTIAVTLLLSFFLAGTIAQPIRRLAATADKVRLGLGRARDLKTFSDRKDEIGDLSFALSAMTRALYDRIDAIEAFAADVAHEIKNPLSSVRRAVETLHRTNDPELQARLLAIIEDDIKRLDRLISDISDASRLDAELSRAEAKMVDLARLTKAIVDTYNATHDPSESSIKIVYENETDEVIELEGLENRLGQVVRNLIDNALSFSPDNGTIFVRVNREGDQPVLTIEDEGPGLPPGVDDRIFERFYSERPADEAFGKHSGLGLNICRQIIEAHGGSISANNRRDLPGSDPKTPGAVFIVRLPGKTE